LWYRKASIVFLLLLLSYSICLAQVFIDTMANYVIAKSGLNLRQKPSTGSQSITVIPFGAYVSYVSDVTYDSMYVESEKGAAHSIKLKGQWVKVKFGSRIGFVLNAYLYHYVKKPIYYSASVNKNIVILRNGCQCNGANFYDPNLWNFKALVEVRSGELVWEKVNVNYLNTQEHPCNLFVFTPGYNHEKIKYIVGERNKISAFNGKDTPYRKISFNDKVKNYAVSDHTKIDVENKDLILSNENYKKTIQIITLISDKKRQALSRNNLPSFGIDVIADLDNDGKDDYIIDFYGEQGFVSLFLSSKADAGEIVKEVARYYHSYCC
jgi:Bacterial SH3 domain